MLQRANRRFIEEMYALSDPGLVSEEYPNGQGISTVLCDARFVTGMRLCVTRHPRPVVQARDDRVPGLRDGLGHGAVPWDDYHLEVAQGDPTVLGQERPLAVWYDEMKRTLRLVAQEEGMSLSLLNLRRE